MEREPFSIADVIISFAVSSASSAFKSKSGDCDKIISFIYFETPSVDSIIFLIDIVLLFTIEVYISLKDIGESFALAP